MKKAFLYIAISCFTLASSGCGKEFDDSPAKIDLTPTLPNEYDLNHPCLVHTNSDFEYVKAKVDAKKEPWLSGWNKLIASSRAQSSYIAAPVEILERNSSGGNFARSGHDSAAAYQLALRWKLTGDAQYADASVKVLNAWASTCKSIARTDGHRLLVAGFIGYQFANAAELMRDYEGWKTEDFEKFKTWIADVFYPHCYEFLADHYSTKAEAAWLSWDAPAMLTIFSIGILCDDADKINFALNYFYNGAGPGCIKNMVVAMHEDPDISGKIIGQSQEMGRDQAHATLDPPLLGYFCQTAYNIGIDLFAYDNNKILALCEYTAKYNVDITQAVNMPYTPYYSLKEGWHNVISDEYRGRARPGWELIYNHYANIKGLDATYSQKFAEKQRPEGGGGQGGEQDDLGFGTLMYTREAK
ncbi:alginate lyase family protein [Dysgonomonas sp. BGC7]|uniref:alginate lyase family protein n=1 Tax=Dysgonomonas sp. BGC7 TaxID=1658008 RepID=UPI0006828F6A|nr:alginate lyase family protein [Dysgonomonas sp. BGC7]MBD8388946.1 alginate lyase family protein [Dysgonomonas sp. BGC7]